MKKTYLKITALIGIIYLVVPMSAVSKSEQKSLLNTTEIEVTSPIANDPLLKLANRVTLTLNGHEDEQSALVVVRDMVNQIIEKMDFDVAKKWVPNISSPAEVMKLAEKWEIVIGIRMIREVMQYQVNVTLSEPKSGKISRYFNYTRSPTEIYQGLMDYLTQQLDSIPQSLDKELQLQTTLNIGEEPQLQNPLIETPSISERRVKEAEPVLVNHKYQSHTPMVDKLAVSSQTVKQSQPVSSKKEVQLKNVSPVIKSISVKLQGSQQVQNVLNHVYELMNDIIYRSRLGVVRIPVFDDPVTTPVIKVSEQLEIVISAILPSEDSQFYKVSLTLQPEGAKGKPQWFEYHPDNLAYFIQDLRFYLTKRLNLQP